MKTQLSLLLLCALVAQCAARLRVAQEASATEERKAAVASSIPEFIDSVLNHIHLDNLTSSSLPLGDILGHGNALEMLSRLQGAHTDAMATEKHYLSASPNKPGEKRKTWITALHEDIGVTRHQMQSLMTEKAKLASASPNSYSCERLPPVYTPYLFCSGVVDYAFYVPAGMTSNDLDHQVRTYGAYFTSYLNTRCLSDVKKMLCGSFYLPCVEGVVPGDTSTYPTANGVNLPYVRPCKSLCTATTAANVESCGGMLEMFGLGSQCDTSIDYYSGLTLYVDGGQPNAVCNNLPLAQGRSLVAEQKEPYIGQVCGGIVKEYSVPPPAAIDPNFAPLLPPFVLQSITEAILSSVEVLIPRYLTSDCLIAQRALVCSSYFLEPYPSDALSMLFGRIYIPSFPDRSVCTNYVDKCSYLIGMVPALAVDCHAKTATGIQLYPNETQAIANINLGTVIVPLTSPTNDLDDMTFTITSQCPYGFAIPEDPSNPGTVLAEGTACAASCPLAIYTPIEYDNLYSQSEIMIWFSLAMTMLQVINISVMKPQRRNIFLVLSIAATVVYLMVQGFQLIAVPNNHDLVCDNPTAWHTFDSFGSTTASNFCVATSFIGPWVNFFSWWILLALSSEIWLRVAWGIKKVEPYRKYYMLGTGIVLFTEAMFVQFYNDPDVMIPGSFSLFCSWGTSDADMKYYTIALPGTFYLMISMAMVAHSIYICVRTSLKVRDADNKPLKKIWKSYSMLFLFMALELIIYPVSIFLFYTKWYYVDVDKYLNGSLDWIGCLFTHFTTSSDESYLEICGTTPSKRIEVDSMLTAFLFTAYLTSVVIFMITLNKEVKEFWWNNFIRLITMLGIKSGLQLLHVPTIALKYLSMAKTNNSANPSLAESEISSSQASMTYKVKQAMDSRRNSYLVNFARMAKERLRNGSIRKSREIKVVAVANEQDAILAMIDKAEQADESQIKTVDRAAVVHDQHMDDKNLFQVEKPQVRKQESGSTLKVEDEDDDSNRTTSSGSRKVTDYHSSNV